MHKLLLGLGRQIKAGLDRASAQSASRWAELYVRAEDPKTLEVAPYNIKYHPWCLEILNENGDWCSKKAAQLGLTFTALIRALFKIDVCKESVLYLLPKKSPDAVDFSRTRFDPLIEESEYLESVFNSTNNTGLKVAGPVALYIRGTRSKSAVKSVPAATLIMDEYDEMHMKNIAQAEQRMTGKFKRQKIKLSTPTAPNFGIDKAFKLARQEHFVFRCPRCNQFTEFVFPDSLVVIGDDALDTKTVNKSYYKCLKCNGKLDHESKIEYLKPKALGGTAIWTPYANEESEERGFEINQYYSTTEPPGNIAKKAIIARDDPAEEEEYYNSVGAQAHIPKGSGLDETMLVKCQGDRKANILPPPRNRFFTMGVDQGKRIWYNVDMWDLPLSETNDILAYSKPITLSYGFVNSFEDLDKLMHDWQIAMCVMDAQPERREAEKFALRFQGFVKLCFYANGITSKSITEHPDGIYISVDRTSWFDQTFSRFIKGIEGIELPKDLDETYKKQATALVKRYDDDTQNNRGEMSTNRKGIYRRYGADHLLHARNYSEIAMPLGVSRQTSVPIENILR